MNKISMIAEGDHFHACRCAGRTPFRCLPPYTILPFSRMSKGNVVYIVVVGPVSDIIEVARTPGR